MKRGPEGPRVRAVERWTVSERLFGIIDGMKNRAQNYVDGEGAEAPPSEQEDLLSTINKRIDKMKSGFLMAYCVPCKT